MLEKAKPLSMPCFMGILGQPGDGKTYSALQLAIGSAGSSDGVFMLDLDGARGRHYANDPTVGGFYYKSMPYNASCDDICGYLVNEVIPSQQIKSIIIDSGTHLHLTMLQLAESERIRLKTSDYRIWVVPKGKHRRLFDALRGSGKHVFITYQIEAGLEEVDGKKKEVLSPIWHKKDAANLDAYIDICRTNGNQHGVIANKGLYKAMYRFADILLPGDQVSIEMGKKLADTSAEGEPEDNSVQVQAAINALRSAAETEGIDSIRETYKLLPPGIKRSLDKNTLNEIAALANTEESVQETETHHQPIQKDDASGLESVVRQLDDAAKKGRQEFDAYWRSLPDNKKKSAMVYRDRIGQQYFGGPR